MIRRMESWRRGTALLLLIALGCASTKESVVTAPQRGGITVASDRRGFDYVGTNKRFVPWGFNYDRDFNSRLIEDYWEVDWPTFESDFREMKRLGANVVRVHLQVAHFMDGPNKPNRNALFQL